VTGSEIPPEVNQVFTGDTLLGECPLWSVTEQALYWVDIDHNRIHRHNPTSGHNEYRTIDGRPGSLALTADDGRLLVATEHQLVWLDWFTGETTPWIALESPSLGNRLNDGRTDPAGRFVVGTMWPDTSERKTTGSLYQVDGTGAVVTLATDIGVPNGIAFDAERGRMYFADTPTQMVLVADYDADTGERHNVRPFLDYGPLPGKPDGGCVDAAGCYWSASIYAWSLIRVTPDGDIDRRVEVPVEKPTMPAFGGADLTTMFVTSIGDSGSKASEPGRDGFTPGDLLAIDVGVEGRPEPLFASL
jgi:L-arabinonolactonase